MITYRLSWPFLVKNYTSSILSISRIEIVQIALIYYTLENHNMCIMEEILIVIKVMDNLISLCQCQSVITFLTFFFYQLYKMFCKYAKEYPDLGMTPAEFAEFLSREQEVSNGELLHLTSVLTLVLSFW